jgi:choline kinase
VKAIVLAAGAGRRLGPWTERHPKALLRFGAESLLGRHLHLLDEAGVEEIAVVTGYMAGQIEREIRAYSGRAPVSTLYNPCYREGSALSVLTAAGILAGSDCILMDADLLYEKELMRRLLAPGQPDCLLVDPGFVDTGEEVKVAVRADGAALELGKSVSADSRIAGESVGMFRLSAATGVRLVEELRAQTASNPCVEYEPAIDSLLKSVRVSCVSVEGLAWIEIDFPEDVERARTLIYPRVAAAGA